MADFFFGSPLLGGVAFSVLLPSFARPSFAGFSAVEVYLDPMTFFPQPMSFDNVCGGSATIDFKSFAHLEPLSDGGDNVFVIESIDFM